MWYRRRDYQSRLAVESLLELTDPKIKNARNDGLRK